MEVKEQNNLTFQGVDILNVQFHSEKPLDGNNKIVIDIVPKVFYPIDKPFMFKIIYETSVIVEGYFSLSLHAIGRCKLVSVLNRYKMHREKA